MNFKVIENPTPEWEEKYEEFIQLYSCSDLTVDEIRKKLDLSQTNYRKARKQALLEGRIVLRRNTPKHLRGRNPRYYYWSDYSKRWIVSKHARGNHLRVICKTEAQAQKVVELLKECDWDKNKIPEIKRKVGL